MSDPLNEKLELDIERIADLIRETQRTAWVDGVRYALDTLNAFGDHAETPPYIREAVKGFIDGMEDTVEDLPPSRLSTHREPQ